VSFYNGSGGSGAEITAETAHQGLSELYASRFGLVFISRPALVSIYDHRSGQLPLEIFTTPRPPETGRASGVTTPYPAAVGRRYLAEPSI
jgi:hypothetical protein